jgi:DNA-binding response OmpR family regulator
LRQASVLLVESNQHAVDTLAQIMTGLGVGEVHRALTAEEAETFVYNKMLDLIIIEPSLRDSDGFEFVNGLRQSRKEPACSVPVIIVTSLTHPSDIARARDTGANFVVAKPITPKVLLQRILWLGRDKRPFVDVGHYVGPDRRFKFEGPPAGMDGRRSDDVDAALGDASAPNMSQNDIDGFIRPQRVMLD